MSKILAFCRKPYTICILFTLILGTVNVIIQCAPEFRERSRENEAVSQFNLYWNAEGAKKFRDVGVEPTEKIYREELDAFLKRFHEQNPPLEPEKRIAQMKEEFRIWWETSGKKSYAVNEIAPDEKLFRAKLKHYIQGYTSTLPEYKIFFIPEDSNAGKLFVAWILFPSLLSFLIFAIGFSFAMKSLEARRGLSQPGILFAAGLPVSGFLFMATLPLSYFDRYADTPYMGPSLALALLLGFSFSDKQRKSGSNSLIAGGSLALLFADILTNWFFNPNLYGWVAILEIPLFGIGALLGFKLPLPRSKAFTKKSSEGTSEQKTDAKIQLRETLNEAIDLANKAEYDHAAQILTHSFGRLLSEKPLDKSTVEKIAESMLYPRFFFPIPGLQWISWGTDAAKKGLTEVAVNLYEKGIEVETDVKTKRRALFYVGELRLQNNIDREKGLKELEEVAMGDSNDILTGEARKLLGK